MRLALNLILISLALSIRGSETPVLSERDQKEAKRLYTMKCSKCHKMYDPAGYSDEDWAVWMNKMSRKSHLKEQQTALLNKYTEDLRKHRERSNLSGR